MTGETQNALALLVGVAALRLAATDAYLKYVKESLRPWLLVAGALLVLLGVVGLLRDGLARRRGAEPAADPDAAAEEAAAHAPGLAHDDEEHDHDHGHVPAVAWLLALPVLAIFLVAPAPLGSFAASRADTRRLTAPKAEFPELPPEENGAIPLTLREYSLRAYYDDPQRLKGKRFRLTGFVTPEGRNVMLTRFVLSCCAADGIPIKVRLVDYQGGYAADTWLEVVGEFAEPERTPDGEVIITRPVPFEVRTVKQIEEPTRPYES